MRICLFPYQNCFTLNRLPGHREKLPNVSAKQKTSRNVHKEGCGWLWLKSFAPSNSLYRLTDAQAIARSRSSIGEAVRKSKVTIA
jgi:hypothetical protein